MVHKDHFSTEYEDEIMKLIRADKRFDRFTVLAYLPIYSFEVDSDIEGEMQVETFDVFKVYDSVSDRETYLAYSDCDNFRLCRLALLEKRLKRSTAVK